MKLTDRVDPDERGGTLVTRSWGLGVPPRGESNRSRLMVAGVEKRLNRTGGRDKQRSIPLQGRKRNISICSSTSSVCPTVVPGLFPLFDSRTHSFTANKPSFSQRGQSSSPRLPAPGRCKLLLNSGTNAFTSPSVRARGSSACLHPSRTGLLQCWCLPNSSTLCTLLSHQRSTSIVSSSSIQRFLCLN